MGKRVSEFQVVKRTENPKRIQKSKTKKCMYCDAHYLRTHLHEHETQCFKRPQPKKDLEVDPQIDSIEFNLSDVLPQKEIDRLTATECKALTYMHKKAIFYHAKSADDFERRMERLGFV